jgi:regulator of protease activity HflC (stomatin/prohibitin superfamily)
MADYGRQNAGASGGVLRGSGRKIAALIALAVSLIVFLPFLGGVLETVDAGEIVVRQGFIDGKLTFWKSAGPQWQWWGKVTHYKKSSQYWFLTKSEQQSQDQSIKLRFNDGGHGQLSGSIRYTLPVDDESLKLLHERFGSQEAIDQSLIRTVMEKAVYFSGPLMSSTQSFAERRNDLIGFIEDQAINGIYKSSSRCEKQPDPVTKQDKTVCMVELERDGKGLLVRVEDSPLKAYKIVLSNLSINDLSYDKEVSDQIKAQQNAIAAVQTAAAEARKAEQRAITVAKEGEANAAKAKWDQEVEKATLVTKAEQEKEVARLAKEAAEYTRQKEILLGEGEAAHKKLVMAADGALAQKLATIVEVNKVWADAYSKQRPTPDVVVGESAGSPASRMNDLVSLMTMAAAREAGLPSLAGAKK